MNNSSLARLRSPNIAEALERYFCPITQSWQRHFFIGQHSGTRVPVQNNIPCLIAKTGLLPENRFAQRYSNFIAPISDFLTTPKELLQLLIYCQDWRCDFLQNLPIKAGHAVLELGCGTGYNLASLPQNADLVGLDFSIQMLDIARLVLEDRHVQLVQGEAERLPFADSSFDLVFVCGGLCKHTNWRTVLTEVTRVLRPDGQFIGISP